MRNKILWPHGSHEDATPLTSGPRQRPLRLTLHTDSQDLADRQNSDAIDLLYELSSLPEIDLLDFEGAKCPRIRIGEAPSGHGHYGLSVERPGGDTISFHAGIHSSRVDDGAVSLIFDMPNPHAECFRDARQHLFALEAHSSLGRDLFVTLSPFILSRRDALDYANPLTPLEASRLAGLVLRTRNNWVFHKSERASVATDRGMFYLVLARSKLPNFWRYFSALVGSKAAYGDRLLRIGQSALERCYRALQARDEMAVQHYLPQNNNTRDLMMYHFDYVTLLLAGVFDAQAAIVNIVYELGVEHWNQGFRRKRFQEALRGRGLSVLLDILERESCNNLMIMLHNLRDTIHSAGLGTLGHLEPARPEASYARVPEESREKLLAAAAQLGGPDVWGMERKSFLVHDQETGLNESSYHVLMEPLTYTTLLIDSWFEIFDSIAAATEVERLFPDGPVDILRDAPPQDWVEMIKRFSLMAP